MNCYLHELNFELHAPSSRAIGSIQSIIGPHLIREVRRRVLRRIT